MHDREPTTTHRGGLAVCLLLIGLVAVVPAAAGADEAGGATGEAGAESLDADAARDSAGAYYTELALMLGRLEAGYALYRFGDRGDGGRQFVAAADVHLPVVREALIARDLELLVERIEKLASRAQASNSWIEVQALHEASRMSLQRAMNQVPPATREDPAFQAGIVLAVAREAVRQYERAVDDGEFVRPQAYQVGYGFISQGRSMVERNAVLLGQADDGIHESLVERYEAVKEAWPSVRVPLEPPLAAETLRDRLSELETLIERF